MTLLLQTRLLAHEQLHMKPITNCGTTIIWSIGYEDMLRECAAMNSFQKHQDNSHVLQSKINSQYTQFLQ